MKETYKQARLQLIEKRVRLMEDESIIEALEEAGYHPPEDMVKMRYVGEDLTFMMVDVEDAILTDVLKRLRKILKTAFTIGNGYVSYMGTVRYVWRSEDVNVEVWSEYAPDAVPEWLIGDCEIKEVTVEETKKKLVCNVK